MNDLSPRDLLERVIRLWWVIAAGMILGGLAGWAFSLTQRPVYQATATYDVSLDMTVLAAEQPSGTTPVPTDFPSQNDYLTTASDVFYQPAVRSRLVTEANAQGIPLKYGDINAVDYYLDRRGTRWMLSVRSTNPAWAAQLVNLWVAATDDALRTARAHMAQVPILQAEKHSVQQCFTSLDFAQANQCAGTSFSSPSDLDTYLSGLDQKIAAEAQAGYDIDPALKFAFVHPADTPTQPVLYNKGLVIFAGCALGFLLGLLATLLFPALRA